MIFDGNYFQVSFAYRMSIICIARLLETVGAIVSSRETKTTCYSPTGSSDSIQITI